MSTVRTSPKWSMESWGPGCRDSLKSWEWAGIYMEDCTPRGCRILWNDVQIFKRWVGPSWHLTTFVRSIDHPRCRAPPPCPSCFPFLLYSFPENSLPVTRPSEGHKFIPHQAYAHHRKENKKNNRNFFKRWTVCTLQGHWVPQATDAPVKKGQSWGTDLKVKLLPVGFLQLLLF